MPDTDLPDRRLSVIDWKVACAFRALKCELAAQRVLRSGRRILALLRAKAYDPAQPRDELGRWTLVGTSVPVSVPGEPPASGQDGRVLVAGSLDFFGVIDLLEEEAGGGHTIAEHVGKTDEEMLDRLRRSYYSAGGYAAYLWRDGSFSSVVAANKLVNSTLAANVPAVEAVASGQDKRNSVFLEFGAVTGREAYRATARGQPYMRFTTGVRVVLEHVPTNSKGFRILTSYPANQ